MGGAANVYKGIITAPFNWSDMLVKGTKRYVLGGKAEEEAKRAREKAEERSNNNAR